MANTATLEKPAAQEKKTVVGGYKDKPWIARFWDGMTLPAWLGVMKRNGFRVSPGRIPMSTIITGVSAVNSGLAGLQELIWGRQIAQTTIEHPPVFIIGHWRSGTTLLHEYLVLDERHTFPDTYACFAPSHHVLTRKMFTPLLWWAMPEQRPIDNMVAGWDRPQEDEFALCNLGLPSPYLTMAAPNRCPLCPEYLDMEDVPAQELTRWKEKFLWFLKSLTLRNPAKRVVLKSPPHTSRVKVLLEMFPQAKFVHIHRDPYVVFPSTVNLWKRLWMDQCLVWPNYQGLDEYVLENFRRMYEAFERDRPLIPQGSFSEVSYEQLVTDPVNQVGRIYDDLQLGGYEQILPTLQKFAAGQKEYKRNRYELKPELRAEIDRRWAPFIEKYGYRDAST
jgi:hypothetical protein